MPAQPQAAAAVVLRVLVHCHAGWPTRDVLAVVGLTEADLFPANPVVIAAYDYADERGELLYKVCRLDPKEFRQRRPNGVGGWFWNRADVQRILYPWPDRVAAHPVAPVIYPEGEKDVERLRGLGLVATTFALPGLPEKGDVSDWLDASGMRDDLLVFAEATPTYSRRPTRTPARTPTNPTGRRAYRTVVPLGVGFRGVGRAVSGRSTA